MRCKPTATAPGFTAVDQQMASLGQHPQRRSFRLRSTAGRCASSLRGQRVGDGMVEEGENGCLERCRIGCAGRQRLGLCPAACCDAARRRSVSTSSATTIADAAWSAMPANSVRSAFVCPARQVRPATAARRSTPAVRRAGPAAAPGACTAAFCSPRPLLPCASAGMRRKQAWHGSGVGRRTLGRCEGKGPAVDERQRCTFALHEAGRGSTSTAPIARTLRRARTSR